MLKDILQQISPLDPAAMDAARRHQDALAIPLGSLGRLHEFGIKLAGITRDPRPDIQNLGVITMAGDHGVAARGVSRFPQEVTREMVVNFTKGGAAINVLARQFGVRLTVVDVGVAASLEDLPKTNGNGIRLVHRKVAPGTQDLSRGPAMTQTQAEAALEVGIRVFLEEKKTGLQAVGTGDMGIANTTPSSAVAAALLGLDPGLLVNRGTGIDDQGLERKIAVVREALEVNRPDSQSPLEVLAKVGGFEIGGIAGVILAACATRTPVVVDGFISTAAALLASRFHPDVASYLFSGHQSAVEGHRMMLDAMELTPMIDFGMRLGEGTGAVFGLAVLAASSRVAREMLTFEEAMVTGPGS